MIQLLNEDSIEYKSLFNEDQLSFSESLQNILGNKSGTLKMIDKVADSTKGNYWNFFQLSNAELRAFGFTDLQIGKVSAIKSIFRTAQNQYCERHIKQIKSSTDGFHIMKPNLENLNHEEFWILCLSRSNKVKAKIQISKGGVSETVVDAKIIFRRALEVTASSIILFHNHPSGNLRPSQSDISLTKKIKQAGEHLNITVLDHLIIAGNSYYSFADDGAL